MKICTFCARIVHTACKCKFSAISFYIMYNGVLVLKNVILEKILVSALCIMINFLSTFQWDNRFFWQTTTKQVKLYNIYTWHWGLSKSQLLLLPIYLLAKKKSVFSPFRCQKSSLQFWQCYRVFSRVAQENFNFRSAAFPKTTATFEIPTLNLLTI